MNNERIITKINNNIVYLLNESGYYKFPPSINAGLFAEKIDILSEMIVQGIDVPEIFYRDSGDEIPDFRKYWFDASSYWERNRRQHSLVGKAN